MLKTPSTHQNPQPLGLSLALLRGAVHRADTALVSGSLERIRDERIYLTNQIVAYRSSHAESDEKSFVEQKYRTVGMADLIVARTTLENLSLQLRTAMKQTRSLLTRDA